MCRIADRLGESVLVGKGDRDRLCVVRGSFRNKVRTSLEGRLWNRHYDELAKNKDPM